MGRMTAGREGRVIYYLNQATGGSHTSVVWAGDRREHSPARVRVSVRESFECLRVAFWTCGDRNFTGEHSNGRREHSHDHGGENGEGIVRREHSSGNSIVLREREHSNGHHHNKVIGLLGVWREHSPAHRPEHSPEGA